MTLRHVMLTLVIAVLAGCAILPTDYPRTASTADQTHETKTVGREVAALAAQHPGQSGFAIVRRGRVMNQLMHKRIERLEKELLIASAYSIPFKDGVAFAKALVDRGVCFRGLNLDARSSTINTEAGLYVESPALAAQVVEYLDEGVSPEVSYRVLMDHNGELYWVASDDGKPLRYDTDPLSTLEQHLKAQFWKIMPILEQLRGAVNDGTQASWRTRPMARFVATMYHGTEGDEGGRDGRFFESIPRHVTAPRVARDCSRRDIDTGGVRSRAADVGRHSDRRRVA